MYSGITLNDTLRVVCSHYRVPGDHFEGTLEVILAVLDVVLDFDHSPTLLPFIVFGTCLVFSCTSAGCHTKYGNHAEVAHASTAGTGRHASIQYLFNHGPINYAIIIIHVLYK